MPAEPGNRKRFVCTPATTILGRARPSHRCRDEMYWRNRESTVLTRTLIATLLLQVFVAPAIAADAAGNYAIWGVGKASCYRFLQSTIDAPDDRYKVFVMGYLTAFNTLSEETYNATGTQTLDVSLVWLADYCELHQMDSFDRAIQQMISTTYDSRQRVPPGRERGWGRAASKRQEPAQPETLQ